MAVSIPNLWGCVPPPERAAAYALSDAPALLLGYVFIEVVDIAFQVCCASWWEVRLAAFLGNWDIEKSTVVIDEIEYDVYLCNRYWMFDLALCRSELGCAIDAPKCKLLTFSNL